MRPVSRARPHAARGPAVERTGVRSRRSRALCGADEIRSSAARRVVDRRGEKVVEIDDHRQQQHDRRVAQVRPVEQCRCGHRQQNVERDVEHLPSVSWPRWCLLLFRQREAVHRGRALNTSDDAVEGPVRPTPRCVARCGDCLASREVAIHQSAQREAGLARTVCRTTESALVAVV